MESADSLGGINISGSETNIGRDAVGGDSNYRDNISAETVHIYNASPAPEPVAALVPLLYIPRITGSTYVSRGIEENVRLQLLAPLGGIAAVVSVFAPGGVGKTQLANAVAGQIASSFDAVHLIEFGIKNVAQVLDDFAHHVGYRYSAGAGIAEKRQELSDFLSGMHRLLILDDVRAENQVLLNDFIPPRNNSTLITSRIEELSHHIPANARFNLKLMDESQSELVLASSLGAPTLESEQESTRRLVSLCRGNPLALDIAARRILSYRGLKNPIALFVSRLENAAVSSMWAMIRGSIFIPCLKRVTNPFRT